MSTSDPARAVALLLALGLLAARPAQSLDEVSRNLAFELLNRDGLRARWSAPYAGEVVIVTRPGDAADAVAARLAAQLAAHGATPPRRLPASPDASAATLAARAAGAEWLVWLTVDTAGRWQASLLDTDPGGLWGAPSGAQAASLALVEVQGPTLAPAPAPPPSPPPATPPRLGLGPLVKKGALPGRVLDLAACTVDGRPRLFALTAEALVQIAPAQARFTIERRLSLQDLPRAAAPTRDPIGQLVCLGRHLAFGHGGLEGGWWRDLNDLSARGVPLVGLPHGLHEDRVLVSPLHAGTNVHRTPPQWFDRAGEASPALGAWPPALRRDYDAARPEGWRALSLGVDLGWHRRADDAPPPSGYGARVEPIDGRLLIVTTSPSLGPGADEVRLFSGRPASPIGAPVPVDGAVHAATFTRSDEGDVSLVLAAWRQGPQRTDLLVIPVQVKR